MCASGIAGDDDLASGWDGGARLALARCVARASAVRGWAHWDLDAAEKGQRRALVLKRCACVVGPSSVAPPRRCCGGWRLLFARVVSSVDQRAAARCSSSCCGGSAAVVGVSFFVLVAVVV